MGEETTIVFTDAERQQNEKTTQLVIQAFSQNHPEILASARGDLANMIREEKQVYSNLAIKFAVEYVSALNKKNKCS